MTYMAKKWKIISLFAGAGGCSLGFSKAGAEILGAYDVFDEAIQTYNLNFGADKCSYLDLSSCDFEKLRTDLSLEVGELDAIIGGPPCQGFTTAGTRFWDDPRNKLVINYANALNILRPRWFMMENVEGILTTAQGTYLIEAIKKMVSLGYSVYIKKVYMQAYGIPQRRKRVIIVGNREGKSFTFPEEVESATGEIYRNTSTTLRRAISDLEMVVSPEIDQVPKYEKGIKLERIEALKQGQTMKDLPEHLQHKSFQRRANRRVADGTPSDKRGGAPSGLKRLIYDEPCLTITSAAISEFVHPTMDRNLTIRECARVQTFPDDFIFVGTDSTKIKQIGNAIPPHFAYLVAQQMMECDRECSHAVEPGLIQYEATKASAMSPALCKTCENLDKLLVNNQKQLTLSLNYA